MSWESNQYPFMRSPEFLNMEKEAANIYDEQLDASKTPEQFETMDARLAEIAARKREIIKEINS